MNAPHQVLAGVRPLVVPVEPIQGESLPGLVARATKANVLGRPDTWLSQIGMTDARPGFIVLHGSRLAPKLAAKIGCTAAEVTARSHPFVTPLVASPVAPIKFGDGELIRGDLDLERRRISPLALELSDHHRSHWLNLLLPYCPESLERLIDRCHCGAKLAWRSAWGIGRCETCREIVLNPQPEFLEQSLVADYRCFADLISADPQQRKRAISMLDPNLQKLDAASLITLILRIGAAFQDPLISMRRSDAHNLPPSQLAAVVATGVRLAQEWPTRFRAAVGEKLERSRNSGIEDFEAFRNALRIMCMQQYHKKEVVDLVRVALPEAVSRCQVALSSSLRPVIRTSEACSLSALTAKDLRILRERGLIDYVRVAGSQRTVAQYDREEMLDLAARIRGSSIVGALAFRVGLPTYAGEQMACLGLLEREAHPAVLALYPEMRIRDGSFNTYVRSTLEGGESSPAPSTAVPISVAMRMFGGSEKPWGAALLALRDGKLPYWLEEHTKFARAILVEPERLRGLQLGSFRAPDYPDVDFAYEVPYGDACEILNLAYQHVVPLERAGELRFHASGKARVCRKQDVLALAARHVSPAEAAWRIGCASCNVSSAMRNFPAVTRRGAGWDRVEFDRTFSP